MENQGKFIQYLIEAITKDSDELRIQLTHSKINLRITDEIIQEQNAQLQELVAANQQISRAKDELEKHLVVLNAEKEQFEITKHQVAHLETFKNELVRVTQERDNFVMQNVDLTNQIGDLSQELYDLRNQKFKIVEVEPPTTIKKKASKKPEPNDF